MVHFYAWENVKAPVLKNAWNNIWLTDDDEDISDIVSIEQSEILGEIEGYISEITAGNQTNAENYTCRLEAWVECDSDVPVCAALTDDEIINYALNPQVDDKQTSSVRFLLSLFLNWFFKFKKYL